MFKKKPATIPPGEQPVESGSATPKYQHPKIPEEARATVEHYFQVRLERRPNP
jgi:hypothetical protein